MKLKIPPCPRCGKKLVLPEPAHVVRRINHGCMAGRDIVRVDCRSCQTEIELSVSIEVASIKIWSKAKQQSQSKEKP